MLIDLNKNNVKLLYQELEKISDDEKKFYHPHEFDMKTLESLLEEKGNEYFLFFDYATFAGYGMLRTFNKYKIPTLGCIIWKRHRGKGYGEQITRELIGRSSSDKIKLSVYPENKVAHHIYKKVGFKDIGEREDGQRGMIYDKGDAENDD